jgi:hypothetical protein
VEINQLIFQKKPRNDKSISHLQTTAHMQYGFQRVAEVKFLYYSFIPWDTNAALQFRITNSIEGHLHAKKSYEIN